MMRSPRTAVALIALVAACGGGHAKPTTGAVTPARALGPTDRILPLLPDGAQVVVEIDLARLRTNAVVGDVATKTLARLGADARLPGLPLAIQGSPLAEADAVVVAAYGVGTPQAATITVLETRGEIQGATRLSPNLVVLGPDEWVGQLQARATIAGLTPDGAVPVHAAPITAPADFLRLRDHAIPAGATGAVLRITARLPFDARIAIARLTGLETAPAQLSIWVDVADDLAVVIDADAADPGDRKSKDAARRLAATIRAALSAAADDPTIRSVGVATSFVDARLVAQGAWVRTIIAIGPRHLARAVERARAMLGAS